MRDILVTVGVLLLLFNGGGAIYGGALLIVDSSGERLGLTLDWLIHSPFNNYLLPGVILLTFNGISSLVIAVLGATGSRLFDRLLFLQGIVLATWLVVQIVMIRYVYFLHYILGTVAVLMVITSLASQKSSHSVE